MARYLQVWLDTNPTPTLTPNSALTVTLPLVRYLEVWLDTNSFNRVVPGCMVRCAQLLNGSRTFYAAYVTGIKRTPRPYKLGKKVAEVALQVRTASGTKLMGIDALSNEKPTDSELARFKLPLEPEEVRKKLRGLERSFAQVGDRA